MALEKLHAQRGSIAIVGAAESDEVGKLPGKSALALHAEGARNALADAGLKASDVDAVLSTGRQTANDVPSTSASVRATSTTRRWAAARSSRTCSTRSASSTQASRRSC